MVPRIDARDAAKRGDTWPSVDTVRSRPGRSVTSMRPSGRKVRPQGWSSPRATVSTTISAFSVLRRCGCCAQAGREATTNATQAKTEQRSMADLPNSHLTPQLSGPIKRSTTSSSSGRPSECPFRELVGMLSALPFRMLFVSFRLDWDHHRAAARTRRTADASRVSAHGRVTVHDDGLCPHVWTAALSGYDIRMG